jgi:hypothetical protein
MKQRPYIRSKSRQNEYLRERPRYRLVKIDRHGNRRQITFHVTNPDQLPEVEKAFLLEVETPDITPEVQTELPL